VFGNFLFSKFFGNSIDEITDGRGFEPLIFHIQVILLSAPFFRGLRRLDFGKIEEKSFTKLWALDCWFSRTNDQRFFAPKKGAEIGGIVWVKNSHRRRKDFCVR